MKSRGKIDEDQLTISPRRESIYNPVAAETRVRSSGSEEDQSAECRATRSERSRSPATGREFLDRGRRGEARCERRLKVIQLLATVTSIFRCTEFPPPLSLYRTKRSS